MVAGVRALLVGLAVLLAVAAADARRHHNVSCQDSQWRKHTMKLLSEAPFAALFHNLKNHSKFEASAITRIRGQYYTVFDSSWALGLLEDEHFEFRGSRLVGELEDGDSQLEGIAYMPEDDTLLLLQEAVEVGAGIRPSIIHAKLRGKGADGYDKLKQCHVGIELSHQNKGLEGIQYVRASNGSGYLLGLCEGNFCEGGKEGRKPGNGRVVVSRFKESGDGDCEWESLGLLELPRAANFQDYSGLAINYDLGKVAILSQEDAAIWVGDFDIDRLEFPDPEGGHVFHLPRDLHCRIIYCNAEGINWIDESRIIVVSDKAKTRQPYWCDQKDQSVHLFQLPQAWQPYDSQRRSSGEHAVSEA